VSAAEAVPLDSQSAATHGATKVSSMMFATSDANWPPQRMSM
jgi:hypothetical protein